MLASGLILMMPTMILSGMIFPIESMPLVMQVISDVLPARWYIQAVRKLMIEGVDVAFVVKEIIILAFMAIVLITVSSRSLKTDWNDGIMCQLGNMPNVPIRENEHN